MQLNLPKKIDKFAVLEAMGDLRPKFEKLVSELGSYEAKGIYHSEMLMVFAAIELLAPDRIIESGRARGQSTEMIARFIMDKGICFDSIEFAENSADVKIASKRLEPVKNYVNLHFGDSSQLVPEILDERRTIVLIDGPKDWDALKLAVKLAAYPNVCAILVHDIHKNTGRQRPTLEKISVDFIASDDEDIVNQFMDLDSECWAVQQPTSGHLQWERPYVRGGQETLSYGPTMCCIPNSKPSVPLKRIEREIRVFEPLKDRRFRNRLSRIINKRLLKFF